MDPDTVPKVKELRLLYDSSVVDITALENEVYDHLYSFFNRYYDEGDFISLRRYKEGVYAIPYGGEEVKLHWANNDQYYIKTTENFRDYAFNLSGGKRVHFKIVEADTEKDNAKAANGKDRRFILQDENPVIEENGELVIRFEYLPNKEKRKQDDLNREAITIILETKGIDLSWSNALSQKYRRADGTASEKTVLEKYLYDYTRRNTFDYFIHKDLGKFLRQELDFYIKNEVMHLDDVENESAPRVEQYLSKIKVIRKIAHKIIEFLAQIEDFQKKLWLKKKFVVETNYCVTLDRVPEALYAEIAKNDDQRAEWVKLFAIDEIQADLAGQVAYSDPLTVEFLKANPYLVIDTEFFERGCKDRLLAGFESVEEKTDGLLIYSENLQSLHILENRYNGKVGYIFIDPPYNTGVDGFPYKDSYQHSSWLSMIDNRLSCCRNILHATGIIGITTDFVEVANIRQICNAVFGADNFLADVAWEKRYTRSNNAKLFYSLKDTLTIFRASKALGILREGRSTKSKKNYTNPDNDHRGNWISSSYINPATQEQRPNLVYEIVNPIGTKVTHPTHAWKYDLETHKKHVEEKRLYWGLDGSYEYPRLKTFWTEAKAGMVPIDVWHYKETGTTDDGGNVIKDLFGAAVFDNPKPPSLIKRFLQLNNESEKHQHILDFFAGSGPTGQAVIDLNRDDGGKRKYILVEMGDYFDTVLKPRIQKVVYSKDWKDGKPVSRNTGVSHMFKYIRLESYEDALANLQFRRTPAQQSLLDQSTSFRESYMLSYLLGMETKDSPSLLNIDQFDDPFNYQLLIGTGSVGETKPVNVDLVETFNWLVGLKVKHIDCIEGFHIVEGTNPKGEKVLVIWRKIRELGQTDPEKIRVAREKANETLEMFFRKQQYNTMDMEFDVIYVNGDNNLMNIPMAPEGEGQEPRYKVRLIEEEFKHLMFDVKGL